MLLSILPGFFVAALASTGYADKCCSGRFTTHEHHEKILQNYVDIWGGDLSIVNSTLASNLTLQIDRFPTGSHGSIQIGPSINSPAAFSSFVQSTRAGFDDYNVFVQKWAGEGNYISLRWTIKAVLGADFKAVPT
jgi:hypothetical protein